MHNTLAVAQYYKTYQCEKITAFFSRKSEISIFLHEVLTAFRIYIMIDKLPDPNDLLLEHYCANIRESIWKEIEMERGIARMKIGVTSKDLCKGTLIAN